MASSISSGSGQASPARRARCKQSMTVVAPIDRLAAILRLDMPAAVNRSTSRILRISNLAPGIGPLSLWQKGPTPLGFADHPTLLGHTPPPDPQELGIARNTRSGSPGARNVGCRHGFNDSLRAATVGKFSPVGKSTVTAANAPCGQSERCNRIGYSPALRQHLGRLLGHDCSER